MLKRYFLIFLLSLTLLGCKTLDTILGIEEKEGLNEDELALEFVSNNNNSSFVISDLVGKTVILLPVRSGMGSGGSDKNVTDALNETLKSGFGKSDLITDERADERFTDLDLWDDYFAYLEKYSQKGIHTSGDLEEPGKLYAPLNPDYLVASTSDLFMGGVSGYYPRAFYLYVELQIWDMKDKQKVWGAICNGHTMIRSREQEAAIYRELAHIIADRIQGELGRVNKTLR